jgi:trigger factor
MSSDNVLTPEAVEAVMPLTGSDNQNPAKLPQKVDISDAGPCKKHVKVTIEGAVIQTRFDEKYSELMLETPTQVPGFRIGKAPRKIVEKKFAKEVAVEVRNEILLASLEQLADEELLSPLAPPQLDPSSVVMPEDGGDLVYEFDIEVRPEFELPNYKGLKIRRPVYTPTEADIQEQIENARRQFSTPTTKPGDSPALELKDIVEADVIIKDGDKVLNSLKDISLVVDETLELDDGEAKEFGKTLVGAKVGDTREFDITLYDNLANEQMRNKVLKATLTVKAVKYLPLPELTTEFLAENFNVRTKEALEILMATRLERQVEYYQRQEAREQVLQLLAGDANWELPQDLLTRQARKTLQRRIMEMQSAGMSAEEIAKREKALTRNAVASTTQSLKQHFVLQKIAEVEKLEIQDADVDAEIEAMAERTGESPRKLRARMQREDMMEIIGTELLERKALDLVLAAAEYEDYPFNPLKDRK